MLSPSASLCSAPGVPLNASNMIIARALRITLRCQLLVAAVWMATVVLHEIEIGGEWLPLQTKTWMLLIAWNVLFQLAFYVTVNHYRQQPLLPRSLPNDAWWNGWVYALSFISAGGALLVVYDFAILRGYGFATSVAAIRVEEAIATARGLRGGSPISGLGRLMIPAMVPAFMIATIRWKQLSADARFILTVSAFITLGEQIFFEGGRFFIATVATTILVCYFAAPGRAFNPKRKRRLPVVRMAIGGAFLLSFFSYVFMDRVLDRGDFFWSAYLGLVKDFTIYVDPEITGRFEGPMGGIWFSVSMFWIYITHPLNELDTLVTTTSAFFSHAGGLYQVPHMAPIASLVFGVDLEYDLAVNLPNVGTYLTFYGANYVDFGHFGAMSSALILGVLTARGMMGFSVGRLDALSIIGPPMLIIALFTPIVSLVTTLWPSMLWAIAVGATFRGDPRHTE